MAEYQYAALLQTIVAVETLGAQMYIPTAEGQERVQRSMVAARPTGSAIRSANIIVNAKLKCPV